MAYDFALADKIFDSLRAHPEGQTAKQVAKEIGQLPANVHTRLSRFALYQMIDRVKDPGLTSGGFRYRYSLKQREPA